MQAVLANSLPDSDKFSRPGIAELEINLFGPGYGESIVVHLGGNDWLTIDSCLDSERHPVGLRYLRDIGVEVDQHVRLVVATHWHDDHIRGLAQILRDASASRLVVSSAMKEESFLALVSAMRFNALLSSTGVDEWSEILNILTARKNAGIVASPQLALGDRLLFKREADATKGVPDCEVWSLSPSDDSVLSAVGEFRQLFPKQHMSKARVLAPSPNHTSIVIWIKVGEMRALLGADLEEMGSRANGWSAIVDSKTRPDGRAEIFKVPHHGSQNGHHPEVWKQLLVNGSTAFLTPFVHGRTLLPLKEDVQRIKSHAGASFITASPDEQKTKRKRKNSVDRTVLEITKNIRNAPVATGHVRLRRNVGENTIRVGLFGTARGL
ncbi:MAG: MBL fold metallo-hydrolase [Verrucomicrobiota bacterium]